MVPHCLLRELTTCILAAIVLNAGKVPASEIATSSTSALAKGTIRVEVVRTPGNAPLPEAEVRIAGVACNVSGETRARTDQGGLVQIGELTPGDYQVELTRTHASTFVQVGAGETENVLLRTGDAMLSSTIVRDGKPLGKAKVRVLLESGGGVRETIADENGWFLIGDLAALPAMVSIHELRFLRGEATHTDASHHERVDLTSGSCGRLFTLPNGRVCARFFGEDGAPAKNATALLKWPKAGLALGKVDDYYTVATGAELQRGFLPAGSYEIVATDPEAGTGFANVVIGDDTPTSEVVVTLQRGGGKIVSLVRGSKGRILPYAFRKLTRIDGKRFPFPYGGKEGPATVNHVPPGKYTLLVSGGGFQSGSERTIEIRENETLSFEDNLVAAGEFVWELDSRSGNSLVGLPCSLAPVSADSSLPTRIGRYGPSGDWTVTDVLPGEYRASVTMADGRIVTEDVSITTGTVAKHTILP